MNNKGFTLVELLATIIVLSIVIGITIPITINSLNKAKEREEKLLIANIRSSVVNLNVECNSGSSLDICSNRKRGITLSDLALSGFLTFEKNSNSRDPQIINPRTNNNISFCKIKVTDDNEFCNLTSDDACRFVDDCVIEVWSK